MQWATPHKVVSHPLPQLFDPQLEDNLVELLQ